MTTNLHENHETLVWPGALARPVPPDLCEVLREQGGLAVAAQLDGPLDWLRKSTHLPPLRGKRTFSEVVFRLSTTEEWHNLGRHGPIRSLGRNSEADDPFWQNRYRSPLRDIRPRGDDPKMVRIDLAHTYSIAGWGKDYLASALVFLAVRCSAFGHGGYEWQLEKAWESYKAWCVRTRRTTAITDFSKQCLKITSHLGSSDVIQARPCLLCLRLQSYPRGLGKGFESALIGRWLSAVLDELDESAVPDSGLAHQSFF